MKNRVSHLLTLLAATAMVMAAVGTAHFSAPPAYGSLSRDLTAGDFHEVAAQGFGDALNSWAWSMAWFNNKLYVGTNRDFLCVEQASFHRMLPFIPYPYKDADLAVPCAANPQAMPVAGEIWALDPSLGVPFTQTNWTRVYQSPYAVAVSITQTSTMTNAPRDMGYRDMTVYTDADGTPALYVSGTTTKPINGANVAPPSLLRTTDGVTFQPVPADPGTTMGDLNTLSTIPGAFTPGACCLRGAVGYNGRFYLIVGQFQGAGSVLVSTDPRQGDNSFQQLTPSSMAVFEMAPFNGHLYLGLDTSKGYTVVRTDAACATLPCPSSAFTTVVPAGGGVTHNPNQGITSMEVFTDTNGVPHLYVGTDGADNATPAEIVRVNTDDSWDLIMGNPRTVNGVLKTPTSGLGSGFGWWFNEHVWRMADYDGVLYAGTFNAATFWKGSALGPLLQPRMGFNLWASTDGLTFTPVTQNGFGDRFSFGARSLTATPYGLFVGSANWWKGLRIWQGSLSPNALQLAPSNVALDTPQHRGAVALAWDAPRLATLFHIYRAALNGRELPRPSALNPEAPRAYLALPHAISLPSAYTAIGTTSRPYFVDQSARRHQPYTYYVVAQDAHGNLSAPSNAVTTGITPGPTFRSIGALVIYWMLGRKIAVAREIAILHALQGAYGLLHSGNVQGSHAMIEALRRQTLESAAATRFGRLYAENLSAVLSRLEKRIDLVDAHIISAAHL